MGRRTPCWSSADTTCFASRVLKLITIGPCMLTVVPSARAGEIAPAAIGRKRHDTQQADIRCGRSAKVGDLRGLNVERVALIDRERVGEQKDERGILQ